MDYKAHGVANSWTGLSDLNFHFHYGAGELGSVSPFDR